MNVVQELAGSSPSANLLSGTLDEVFTRTDGNGPLSYLRDALGSTQALTDSTGAIQQQYTYDPYGSTSTSGNSTSNSYEFTGRETDATGLYYLRARYYNPTTGRFLSEDPAGFRAGINLYAYVYDSPVVFTDPSGKDAISGAITGAIFGALGADNAGDALGGAIAGGIAGGIAGAFLPPGPLTGAAAAAAGDLAGQELGNMLNGESLSNVNGGEIAGSALAGATGGLFGQGLNALGASAELEGPALDWGSDIASGNLGLVGGLLGKMLGNPPGGNAGGCSMAARKC